MTPYQPLLRLRPHYKLEDSCHSIPNSPGKDKYLGRKMIAEDHFYMGGIRDKDTKRG
jgi:hypothetical protein